MLQLRQTPLSAAFRPRATHRRFWPAEATADAQNVAANLSVQVTPPTGVPVFGTASLHFTVVALDATVQQSTFQIHISTAEGATADLTVNAHVSPLVPRLVVTPAAVEILNRVGYSPTGLKEMLQEMDKHVKPADKHGFGETVPPENSVAL